jgi:hypothetical protein
MQRYVVTLLVFVPLFVQLVSCNGCAQPAETATPEKPVVSSDIEVALLAPPTPSADEIANAKYIDLPMDVGIFEPIRIGVAIPESGPKAIVKKTSSWELLNSADIEEVFDVTFPRGARFRALVDSSKVVTGIRVQDFRLRFDTLGMNSKYSEILIRYPDAQLFNERGFATHVLVKRGIHFCFFPWKDHLEPDETPAWIDFKKY